MTLKIFAIRDSKGSVYNQPWFSRSHGEAERNFQNLVTDQNSMIHKFPEDFDLYHLGEYDDQTGFIKSLDTPQHLTKAVTIRQA